MTYHMEDPTEHDVCVECGEPATVVYVADATDSEGYVDAAAYCDKHDSHLDVQP